MKIRDKGLHQTLIYPYTLSRKRGAPHSDCVLQTAIITKQNGLRINPLIATINLFKSRMGVTPVVGESSYPHTYPKLPPDVVR